MIHLLHGLIELILEFFFMDVPRAKHREHEKKYGIPGENPTEGLEKAAFIIKCTVIALIVLALPVLAIIILRGM